MIREQPIKHDVMALLPKAVELLERRGVVVAYLFGSYARGSQGPMSDLDLAVLLSASIPSSEYLDQRLEILAEVTRVLRTDEVDLVVLNEAPIELAFRIISEGKLLYCTDDLARARFQARNMILYFDIQPTLSYIRKGYLGIERGKPPWLTSE